MREYTPDIIQDGSPNGLVLVGSRAGELGLPMPVALVDSVDLSEEIGRAVEQHTLCSGEHFLLPFWPKSL